MSTPLSHDRAEESGKGGVSVADPAPDVTAIADALASAVAVASTAEPLPLDPETRRILKRLVDAKRRQTVTIPPDVVVPRPRLR